MHKTWNELAYGLWFLVSKYFGIQSLQTWQVSGCLFCGCVCADVTVQRCLQCWNGRTVRTRHLVWFLNLLLFVDLLALILIPPIVAIHKQMGEELAGMWRDSQRDKMKRRRESLQTVNHSSFITLISCYYLHAVFQVYWFYKLNTVKEMESKNNREPYFEKKSCILTFSPHSFQWQRQQDILPGVHGSCAGLNFYWPAKYQLSSMSTLFREGGLEWPVRQLHQSLNHYSFTVPQTGKFVCHSSQRTEYYKKMKNSQI